MPSSLATGILFLSAYSPLIGLFAILDSLHSLWSRLICAGITVLSLAGLALFWKTAKDGNPRPVHTTRTRRRDEDVITFFVAYVVPFAVAPLDTLDVKVALLAFIGLVGLLYFRASLYRVHPILLLAGFHLYEVEQDVAGEPVLSVLTRRQVMPQQLTLNVIAVVPGLVLEKKGANA